MNKDLLSYLKSAYFLCRQIYLRTREILFVPKPTDLKNIPIIINNFNRLTFLKMLIEALEKRGYNNIFIIDNASTYPPLLNYYATIPYKIFYLKDNVGYLALWQTGIYKQFKNQYFVYTDSDVVPIDDCPDDFLTYFFSLMQRYPRASKVGFALKIDDIPITCKNRAQIYQWETKFWQYPLGKDIYRAAIDTTFALYRPNVKGGAYFHDFMIRTAGLYLAKHMPWYNDDENLSEEEKYYITHTKTSTHWTLLAK